MSDPRPSASDQPTLPPSPPPADIAYAETLPPSAPADAPTTENDAVRVPGYEILGELGRGGMGVVYKARQTGLDRIVALKMILAGGHAGEADLARFKTEAAAIARLQHPNIVQIHEVGEHNGLPYFSLEFCSGGSLEQKLRANPLPPNEAAALVETLARAMHAAHEKGVIHRDLKPANVLLAADGTPKVTDFGLAKKLDEAGQTASGAVMGTPSYMAPEQAGGKSDQIGPAADVYALGAILYECLTGRPPFRAATPLDTILQVISDEPVPVRQLNPKTPRDLETICHKCLHKDPRRRYGSGAELAEDLRRFQAGEAIAARPVGRIERVVKWVKRRPAVAVLLLLVVVLTAVGVGAFGWAYSEALREREAFRQQLAYSRIPLAEAALRDGDVDLAHQLLEEVPVDLRQWEWYYLTRQYDGSLFTVHKQDKGRIFRVRFSPDGQLLATVGYVRDEVKLARVGPNEIKVWDVRTGKLKHTIHEHGDLMAGVCFSPNSQRLAWISRNKQDQTRVKVVNPQSGWSQLDFEVHADDGVCFSSDSSQLTTAGIVVEVWDVETGRKLRESQRRADIGHVAFSPDGKWMADGAEGIPGRGEIKVWDVEKGEIAHRVGDLKYHDALAISSDGKSLAVAPGNVLDTQTWKRVPDDVRVFDVTTGQELVKLKGHTDLVMSICFSPEGRLLATGSSDRTIKVWDTQTGRELRTLRGHQSRIRDVSFSPDGQYLATGCEDGTAALWMVQPDQAPLAHKWNTGPAECMTLSRDGQRLATGSWDKTARIWDPRTGQMLLELKGPQFPLKSLAFSADGRYLAAGGGFIDPTRSEDRAAQAISSLATPSLASGMTQLFAVTLLLRNRDERGELRIWDMTTGEQVSEFKGKHPGIVRSVCFSPDGQRLATARVAAAQEGRAYLWDMLTGGTFCHGDLYHDSTIALAGSYGPVAFNPDGESVMGPGPDGSWRVWNARVGKGLRDVQGRVREVLSICFSPDGKRLATTSDDRTAQVWDARTGNELLTLKGHIGPVRSVAFSADGQRLATASEDGTARIWDARTGQQLLVLKAQTGKLIFVAFSADGLLFTLSEDGTAQCWDGRPFQMPQ